MTQSHLCCAMLIPATQTTTPALSTVRLRELADRFFIRETVQAELLYLLGQLRQMEDRALDLPEPDGVLLLGICKEIDERVSSRLLWLLDAEKHSLPLEIALLCCQSAVT